MLFVFLMMAALCSHASDKGNGGDPIAQQFASTLKSISVYLDQNYSVLPRLSRNEIKTLINELQSSLGSSSSPSLIEVLQKRPRDQFGVEKSVVTTVAPLKVYLHSDSWTQPNIIAQTIIKRNQVVMAGMELLLLAGVNENRYQIANDVFGPVYLEILESVDYNNTVLPPIPKKLLPFKNVLHGRERKLINDGLVQMILNTDFLNCQVSHKLRLLGGSQLIGVYDIQFNDNAKLGSTILETMVSEELAEFSTNESGDEFMARFNVNSYGRWIQWGEKTWGINSYKVKLNSNQTRIKEVEFYSSGVSLVNVGTVTKPVQIYKWIPKEQSNFTCSAE